MERDKMKFSKKHRARGGGRKPLAEPLERRTITLLKSDADWLRSVNRNISQSIREIIRRDIAAKKEN